MFDPHQLKADFPLLSRQVNGHPLVYLDNAATSQKPRQVVEAMSQYYYTSNANVHRGVHTLSDESTQLWEQSRQTIAHFFGAQAEELIITRNTTEALNGIAYGWAESHLQPGDIILTTLMEHHSDLVTWQQVCTRTGAELAYLPVDEQGRLVLDDLESYLSNPKLKLVALTHVSNSLGTLNPVADLSQNIKSTRKDVLIVIDGAQSAPHLPINFDQEAFDCFVFSGHKMLGPMGIGGMLVKKELLSSEEFSPWLFGGGMIAEVSKEKTSFSEDLSDRFTAGTPDVAGLVGLAAACEYLKTLGMQAVREHDRVLVQEAINALKQLSFIHLIGPVQPVDGQELDRIGSVAFLYEGVHAHDVAQILDGQGIAVRSGHHCTMPLHVQFNWQATVRASFQVYTTSEDIASLAAALHKVSEVFKK